MYHPSRGGVRGGRDQFKWDDVKVDKHRENYLGHSLMAPVGRWQKGKDLHWYARDKKSNALDAEAAKEEIKRIKEEEEQAMLEALGLAPKRASQPQGNRLDKHEYAELVKRGSTAEDLGAGHAEAAQVQGLGLYKPTRNQAESSSLLDTPKHLSLEGNNEALSSDGGQSDDDRIDKKRRDEERTDKEKRHYKREKKRTYDSDDKGDRKRAYDSNDKRDKKRTYDSDEKREKKRTRDSDDRRKHGKEKREKTRRRHDSD